MLYAAVSMGLFSDGLMIGAGSVISPKIALILPFGQVLADVPEGFATIAISRIKISPVDGGFCFRHPLRFCLIYPRLCRFRALHD